MKFAVVIPYTEVKFRTSRGKSRDICVDSFAIAHISSVIEYPMIVVTCKSVGKFKFSSTSIEVFSSDDFPAMKVLRREVPSYDVLKYVINAYRDLSAEISSLRKEIKLNPSYALMFWLSPASYIFSNTESRVVKLSKASMSLLLLETLLGKELLYEDPVIININEFSISLLAEVNNEVIKFIGKDVIIKLYNKLVESDEKYRSSLIKALTH